MFINFNSKEQEDIRRTEDKDLYTRRMKTARGFEPRYRTRVPVSIGTRTTFASVSVLLLLEPGTFFLCVMRLSGFRGSDAGTAESAPSVPKAAWRRRLRCSRASCAAVRSRLLLSDSELAAAALASATDAPSKVTFLRDFFDVCSFPSWS